jgi:hypothetical protein
MAMCAQQGPCLPDKLELGSLEEGRANMSRLRC